MRKSMTAYGRSKHQSSLGRWSVDIHSVNRKGLDIHVSLPPSLLFLDGDLRSWVGEAAERGAVTVRVSFELEELKESVKLLKNHKDRWEKIASALGYSKSSIDLSFLLERLGVEEIAVPEKALKADLQRAWIEAANQWLKMKQQEGKTLVKDIDKRLKTIEQELQKVEKLQPQLQEKYRNKIEGRMKELKIDVPEELLIREAALLAEKADITEEITRLYSHIEQMDGYLCSKEKSVGRTLDFLAQEMGREIGTLMAKAGETEISKLAIKIKSEIEKIREQVQNIE